MASVRLAINIRVNTMRAIAATINTNSVTVRLSDLNIR